MRHILHLAGHRHGKFRHETDAAKHLVMGNLSTAAVDHPLDLGAPAIAQAKDRAPLLTVLVVGGSDTLGRRQSTSSNSRGQTFSPPRMIPSVRRPATLKQPCSLKPPVARTGASR